MDELEQSEEITIKEEEIEEEPSDDDGRMQEDSKWNIAVKTEHCKLDSTVEEQSDSEEEVKPPVAVFLQPDQESEEGIDDEEDPLAFNDVAVHNTSGQTENELLSSGHNGYCSGNPSGAKSSERTATRQDECRAGDRCVCAICNKLFSSKRNLRVHMRIHTGEKPYECSWCKKRFAHEITHKRHIRVHTGDKPYICSVCKKGFTQKSLLDSHIRIHHTGERPFQCSVCKKRFNRKIQLNNHMNVHSRETLDQCWICKIGFRQRRYFLRHMLTHANEYLVCSQCKTSSAETPCLAADVRMKNEESYVCSVCGKEFALERYPDLVPYT